MYQFLIKVVSKSKNISFKLTYGIQNINPNIDLFGFFYVLSKNKYANYQTLIKLLKKLLCFVINSCTFVRQ